MNFSASLDTASLAALARMQGFAALLSPEIVQALTESGQLLVKAAQDNTWRVFDNPTGQLADSITFYVVSPEEVEVSVGVPYGHRREVGFSGKVDSLGRFYPNDPARPYLVPALQENEGVVLDLISAAVESALGRVAHG
jgi:hypothetical protein